MGCGLTKPISGTPEIILEYPNYPDYRKWKEITSKLKEIHEEYKDITELQSLGGSAKDKRDIWLLSISKNISSLQNTPSILIVGAHHGREAISVETALYVLETMLKNKGHKLIAPIIENYAVHIMVLMNPDGRERITRKNGNEVDLNRNYKFGWGGPGCSHDPWDQTYCGPSPQSESETQLTDNIYKKFPIKFTITYHSGTEAILYPWGDRYESIPDEDMVVVKRVISFTEEFAKKITVKMYDAYQSVELYPTAGTYEDHVYATYNALSFCVEVFVGGYGSTWDYFNPPKDKINNVCRRNIPLVLALFREMQNIP